ncbi:MAG: TonB-dependent receptor [Bacteroidota bacterium]
MKQALLLFSFFITSLTLSAQTALSGQVTDADGGDPLIAATVAIYKDGNLEAGNITDIDGNFYFANIDAGVYAVEVTYTGYQTQRLEGVQVNVGEVNKIDVALGQGVNLDVVEVIEYLEPLVKQDETTRGDIVTSTEIRQLPTRSINALAATGAGVASADEGRGLNIRGARENATFYYVDGIRVQGNLIQESEIEQLQTVIGGVPAEYGDVAGGFVSITTKGPSSEFSGSVEVETSEGLDDFGQSLAGFSLSGPILKSARNKNKSILGFRLAGRYTIREDDFPSAVPLFRVQDEALAELEANPLTVRDRGNNDFAPFIAADFLGNGQVDARTTRPFEEETRADITGKLDIQVTDGIDIQLTGYYGETDDQFTPGTRTTSWRVYNSHNNPTRFDTDYRINARFRHRLGQQGSEDASKSVIQNASYTLQFGYERNQFDRSDPRHGDDYFAYGHVGNFDVDFVPVFAPQVSSSGLLDSLVHIDYRAVLAGYDDSQSSNPVLSNYNNIYGIDEFNDGGLYGVDFGFVTDQFDPIIGSQGLAIPNAPISFVSTNGGVQNIFQNSWNLHANVGTVFNRADFGDNEIFTFNANANLDIKPGGGNDDANRHSIQFGIMYEQRTLRSYAVAPRGLWTLGRLLVNQHLVSVDPTNRVVGQAEISELDNPFGISGTYDVYAPTANNIPGRFYRELRERLGINLDEFVNIDGLDPDQLSLDMFSAQELNDAGLLGYRGYDYLGNEFNGSFDDFFGTIDPTTGLRGENTFAVAPLQPIYTSAFIQDKFRINDMFFRLGVRIDRFDANTKVLSDPYSLFRLQGAAEWHGNNAGVDRPGNIGDDFAVYLNDVGGNIVQAYRDGENWFLPDGTPVNGPQEIAGIREGLVFPAYENQLIGNDNFIKDERFQVDDAFDDYEVQVNVMPRLSFSFPISDASNFFAHYDVLVQRPASNNLATAATYFYFVDRPGTPNNPLANPDLRPTRTIDYEVGFQQRLSPRSAIKVSAYYRELRDMIQLRTFFPVPLVNQYTTYGNQDFGTTKGFNLTYDLRRTGNIKINANYSLAFADGTGSDANAQRGLTNRGGNLRTLFPLNFDERHRINFIIDYRLDNNAPSLLKNLGLNVQSVAVSGRPYTQTQTPEQFGGESTIGGINGARKPWTFTVNARLDKQIFIGDNIGLNLYCRVSNLLDRRNVLDVYSFTGSPEDPGWLQSRFGQQFLQQVDSQILPTEGFLDAYSWSVLTPGFFTLPRRIFVGAIVSF